MNDELLKDEPIDCGPEFDDNLDIFAARFIPATQGSAILFAFCLFSPLMFVFFSMILQMCPVRLEPTHLDPDHPPQSLVLRSYPYDAAGYTGTSCLERRIVEYVQAQTEGVGTHEGKVWPLTPTLPSFFRIFTV